MPEDAPNFGQVLDGLRRIRSLSQEAFSDRAGISRSSYFRLVKGEIRASRELIIRFADALQVDPEKLERFHFLTSRKGTMEEHLVNERWIRNAQRLAIELRREAAGLQRIPIEDVNRLSVAEPDSSYVAAGLPQGVRVFIQRFLLELTEAGATDDDVVAARELLTRPEVFTLHHGGRPTEATEEQVLQVMEVSARFIRDTLRDRGLEL